MKRLIAWCVPASAFWSWRDQLHVFYDKQWINVWPWQTDRREARHYMRFYGVLYR